jgi:NAD(P)-dependent dehydrogenase (short-subunit alcohol dehydrogenase family)
MAVEDLSGATAIVTGASRGFGRAVAGALSALGATVVGVARDQGRLDEVKAELGESFLPVAADASDPVVAGQLIDRFRPRVLVLNAGATPLARPIQLHTWETFSRNWDVDARHVFHWIREALLAPLDPGSVVVSLSSGAAIKGSPLSGGYAGAKATIRFLSAYAAEESQRLGLGIRFASVLPPLMPGTDVGTAGVAGYAKRQGVDVATFIEAMGTTPGPDQIGKLIVELVTDSAYQPQAYVINAAGLSPAP